MFNFMQLDEVESEPEFNGGDKTLIIKRQQFRN